MCWIQICQSGHTRCEITCPVILLCFICVLKWMGWIYNHIVCISPVEWRRRAGVLACLAGRSCKTWHHIATCPVVHLGKYHLLAQQWNDTTRNVFHILPHKPKNGLAKDRWDPWINYWKFLLLIIFSAKVIPKNPLDSPDYKFRKFATYGATPHLTWQSGKCGDSIKKAPHY